MIVIDTIEYDVPIVSLEGQADMLDKYAERTVDGVLHRELIGVYDNYDIEFAASYSNLQAYSDLWFKLTEPTPLAYSCFSHYSWGSCDCGLFCKH